MSNTQHSQGPWEYLPENGSACGAITSKTGWVCDFAEDPSPADARLIAAAPGLLEALKNIMNYAWCERGSSSRPHFDHVYAYARAAIAKATGGEA